MVVVRAEELPVRVVRVVVPVLVTRVEVVVAGAVRAAGWRVAGLSWVCTICIAGSSIPRALAGSNIDTGLVCVSRVACVV